MKFSEIPYSRVTIEEVRSAFASLTERMAAAASGEEQFQVHQDYYKLSDRIMTQSVLAEIRHDGDMTDPFYDTEYDYYDEHRPEMMQLQVAYQKLLYESKFRPYLEEKIGPVAFKNMELARMSVDERILPLMQEENKLCSRYNKLLATARIEWEGEQLNLSLMRPYLTHTDRGIRQKAWSAYTAFFEKNREELDEIYDLLVRNRTKQAQELGYENYLKLGYARMNRNCYGREEVQSFRRQIREDLVPFTEKLHEGRARRLGISRLMYYDESVYDPAGNPQPTGTPEEILQAGRRMYGELSPETGEFMNFMCDNELFDVLGRKNKKTGGYMTYLPEYQSPFIFANFNGTSGDVDVITHECGHAFQGYLAGTDPIREHADITMETAETHSMSMEYFTYPWMSLFFGERADDYRRMHFEDSVCFVPYGTMVDEFQDIIYDDPGLTPAARRQVWLDLERQYRPHMCFEGSTYLQEGGFWQKQHHIYDLPLYYIDYCIASIDALQYKVWMDQDYHAAWDSYLKLCRLSASDYFTGLLPEVGLTVPFEDGCVRYIVRKLEERGM